MELLIFLVVFILMLPLGTLAVTGWYVITRGEKEVQPDNSIKKTGKIFKGFYFFFTKEKDIKKRIYYKNRQLQLLYNIDLRGYFNENLILDYTNNQVWLYNEANHRGTIAKVEEMFNINFDYGHTEYANGSPLYDVYYIYAEYPDYVFPEWVRLPMAECATCMASVYGTIFYWLFLWLIRWITRVHLFAWSDVPILASLCFWVAFCFSLSVLNTYVAKKV